MTEPGADEPWSKRDDVLHAALGLFAEKSVTGARMPELAARAGVGAGTIYRYFASKEALANAVYQRGKRRILTILTEAAERSGPVAQPWVEFSAIWDGLWAFAVEDREAVLFAEAHQHTEYLDDESRDLEQAVVERTAEAIARGQAEGVVRPGNPQRLAAVVFGAFLGLLRAAGQLDLDGDDREDTKLMLWAALTVRTPETAP